MDERIKRNELELCDEHTAVLKMGRIVNNDITPSDIFDCTEM